MKKIPSIWQRNYDGDRLIRPEVVPGCEWVLAGQGYATRKYDGTACMVQDGTLYKRYDAKKGKTPPAGFLPCEASPDSVTGHWPGWLPVGDGNEDQWHREAWDAAGKTLPDGTYELLGPRIQGNPEEFGRHHLLPHGKTRWFQSPCGFETMKEFLARQPMEGLVYYHPDGRMAKVKRKDFGLPWPVKEDAESEKATMNQVIEKVWGEEEVIVNEPLVCSKFLYLKPGFVCSEHRHWIKTEYFHVFAGDGVISVQGKLHRVKQGDTVAVPNGKYHFFASQNGMTILEISTQHLDSDVERLSESHALDPGRDAVILRWLAKEGQGG